MLIIPIFVPNAGCPHDCCFCDQKKISGAIAMPTVEEIAKNTAGETGVEAVMDTSLKAFVVYNNPYISTLVLESAKKVAKGIQNMPEKLSSEDFSQYLTKKPGVFIRLGTRNEEKGCVTLPHNNDFLIDEDALPIGTDTCVQFVLDNMNGIDMEEIEKSDERKKKLQ